MAMEALPKLAQRGQKGLVQEESVASFTPIPLLLTSLYTFAFSELFSSIEMTKSELEPQ